MTRTGLIQYIEAVDSLRVTQEILCAKQLSYKTLHNRTMGLNMSSAHTGQKTSAKTGFKLLKNESKLILYSRYSMFPL